MGREQISIDGTVHLSKLINRHQMNHVFTLAVKVVALQGHVCKQTTDRRAGLDVLALMPDVSIVYF